MRKCTQELPPSGAGTELERQRRLWSHFQTSAPETFEGARPRLSYLLGQIDRLKRGGAPRVLNVGAGEGFLEEKAAQRGWRIHTVDPDQDTVKRLRARDLEACPGLVEQLPFRDQRFEFVVASEVLEHLDDRQLTAGLAEIGRVLAPGGWLLGTVPYAEDLSLNHVLCPQCGHVFHRWGHRRAFGRAELQRALLPIFGTVHIRRRAFVAFKGAGLLGLGENLVRILLARLGARIASTSLLFLAQR